MSIFRYFRQGREDKSVNGVRVRTTKSGTTHADVRDLVTTSRYRSQSAAIHALAKAVIKKVPAPSLTH